MHCERRACASREIGTEKSTFFGPTSGHPEASQSCERPKPRSPCRFPASDWRHQICGAGHFPGPSPLEWVIVGGGELDDRFVVHIVLRRL